MRRIEIVYHNRNRIYIVIEDEDWEIIKANTLDYGKPADVNSMTWQAILLDRGKTETYGGWKYDYVPDLSLYFRNVKGAHPETGMLDLSRCARAKTQSFGEWLA